MNERLIQDPAQLTIENQVKALCLAADLKNSVKLLTDFVTQIKGSPLTPEEEQLVRSTYDNLKDSINWGSEDNYRLIEEQIGVTYGSICSVIADNLLGL